MRFDRTEGKTERYVVSLYGENVEDHYYYHYYNKAKKLYESMRGEQKPGTVLSIYDVEKDIRKEFSKK